MDILTQLFSYVSHPEHYSITPLVFEIGYESNEDERNFLIEKSSEFSKRTTSNIRNILNSSTWLSRRSTSWWNSCRSSKSNSSCFLRFYHVKVWTLQSSVNYFTLNHQLSSPQQIYLALSLLNVVFSFYQFLEEHMRVLFVE